MNIFYKFPSSIWSKQQVKDFFNSNRYIILIADIFKREAKCYQEFQAKVAGKLKNFYNVNKNKDVIEFEKNLPEGLGEYAKNPKENYSKFWNFDKNVEILTRIDRTNDQTIPLFHQKDDLISYLRNNKQVIEKDEDGNIKYTLRGHPKYKIVYIDNAIRLCGVILGVIFKEKWSLFNLFGYKYYDIYDVYNINNKKAEKSLRHIGGCYVRFSEFSRTTPLGVGGDIYDSKSTYESISLVTAPNTQELIHELSHAVQFCFTEFYNIPRELLEIPTMCIERHYQVEFQPQFINKTIALSIADLNSNNAKEFDNIYMQETGECIPVQPSSRFWHYIYYNQKYYSYALGIILPFNTKLLQQWIRDPYLLVPYIQGELLKNKNIVNNIDPSPDNSNSININSNNNANNNSDNNNTN